MGSRQRALLLTRMQPYRDPPEPEAELLGERIRLVHISPPDFVDQQPRFPQHAMYAVANHDV